MRSCAYRCAVDLARLSHRVELLAAALGIDMELLGVAAQPDVRNGCPGSWEAMLAAGYDPIDGEALEVAP